MRLPCRKAKTVYNIGEVDHGAQALTYRFIIYERSTLHEHLRHLLKDGKAKIVKHHPFTIQLLYDSKTNTQPIEICEDVGYNYIGISVKSQSHEYVSAQYDTLQDEKACHDSCRKLRRTRRNRLRYRKPRFDNRKRGEGWLAPSLSIVR